MKKLLPLVLIFTCLLSCEPKEPKHLSRKELAGILTDIQLAEVYSTMVPKATDSLHKKDPKNLDSLAHYYKEILAHHHTTEQYFFSSMEWYRAHPTDLDSVYQDVLGNMAKMKKDRKLD